MKALGLAVLGSVLLVVAPAMGALEPAWIFAGLAHYGGFAINLSPDCLPQHLDGSLVATLVGPTLSFAFENAAVPLSGLPCFVTRSCVVFGDVANGWSGPCPPAVILERASLRPNPDGTYHFEASSLTIPTGWFLDGDLAGAPLTP